MCDFYLYQNRNHALGRFEYCVSLYHMHHLFARYIFPVLQPDLLLLDPPVIIAVLLHR